VSEKLIIEWQKELEAFVDDYKDQYISGKALQDKIRAIKLNLKTYQHTNCHSGVSLLDKVVIENPIKNISDEELAKRAKQLIGLIDLGHEQSWHSLQEWTILSAVKEALLEDRMEFFERSRS
jgi:hypothetical protein